MDQRVIHGIRWTVLGYAANRAVSLAMMLVLARILVPADFGIVAFGLLLSSLLSLFATLGLSPALVVVRGLTSRQFGTALTLLICLHVAAAIALVAAAPLARDLLGDPRAAGVIAALAVPLALQAFPSFYSALLQRQLEFGRRFVGLAAGTLATAASAVTLGVLGAGVWSLVGGQFAGTAVTGIVLIGVMPDRVWPAFDREATRIFWRSGRGFMLQGGISFIEQNTDFMMVGSVLGARPLGLYSIAFRLAELPYSALVEPVAQATFPGFARMHRRAEDPVEAFLTVLRVITLCALPLGAILSGVARPFVDVVLGPNWLETATPLMVLGIWGAMRTVSGTIGWFVNSVGHSWTVGLSYAVLLIPSVPLLFGAAALWGIVGVAWVMLANVIATTGIVAGIAQRKVGVPLRRQMQAVLPSLLGGCAAWVVAASVSTATGGAPAAFSLVAAAASGLISYVLVVRWLDPGFPRDVARYLSRALSRAPKAGGALP